MYRYIHQDRVACRKLLSRARNVVGEAKVRRVTPPSRQEELLSAFRRNSIDANAPPLVNASFQTHEEAEAWLDSHPRPPDQAYVLVAGEYHIVMYSPERNHRRLLRHPALEFYLEEMTRGGLPTPTASFQTRAEAEAWAALQPEPPRQVFIMIAGEYHLAVYHHRIHQRAIYPVSLAAKPRRTS